MKERNKVSPMDYLNSKSIAESQIKRAQITDHEKECLILAAVCCNYLLHAGIDYKNINGKLKKVKGKEAYLVNDFLRRCKDFHNAVNGAIDTSLTGGETLEKAADDINIEMPEDEQAYNLLWYSLNQLHRFSHLYIRNLRISLKKLRINDVVIGEQLFKTVALTVIEKDDNKTQDERK